VTGETARVRPKRPARGDGARRPTVADVAQEAGVSPSTVSRVLSGNGYAASEVRERVQATVRRLGYVPDANARTLRNRSSRSIGVLISDLRNPFYADLAAGVEQELRCAGYHTLLVNDNSQATEEMQAVENFLAMRVSGVIITPVSARAVKTLHQNGIRVVQADRRVSQRYGDAVLGANDVGAELVTRYLLDLGHRRIGLLIDETRWTSGAGRLAGYIAAHQAAGVPVDERLIVHSTRFDALAAQQATAELLDTHPDVTAVFAANNVLAQGALDEVQRRDIAVPRQLSLAGYDDVPWMSMVRPAVTTVTQHTVELGRRCARVLLDRLNGDAATRKPTIAKVAPELLVRESTAPPPRFH